MAFVVWGDTAWPPQSQVHREALATAIGDALESTHFEAFLALISAESAEARRKLLRLAGAPSEPPPIAEGPDDGGLRTDVGLEKTAGEAPTETPATPDDGSAEAGAVSRRTPLLRPENLLIGGEPLAIVGESHGDGASATGHTRSGGGGNASANYGGRTDLAELNELGMYVALTYECHRLRKKGHPQATVLDITQPVEQADALVFDVSTVLARDAAMKSSPAARAAFAALKARDVSMDAPGFDILSLDPTRPDALDRLIELKSSGGNARLQGMTWNEWKTARKSDLRPLFYLYLVGNLRSDLDDAVPFIKMIRDPFESVWAEEQHHQATSRKVQLNVGLFTQAEMLKLGVRKADGGAHAAETA
jgi:hypothetical protein